MSGLNYSIFYKAKFTLKSRTPEEDLLWNFMMCIRQWQMHKWNKNGAKIIREEPQAWTRLKNGGRLFSADGSERPVYMESEYFSPANAPEQQFWACKISEKGTKGSGYCERDWVTEIGFCQREPLTAEFQCVISYGDRADFIGRYEGIPEPTLPRLIDGMLQSQRFSCLFGAEAVKNEAVELKVGDFFAFREALICPDRKVPYIYISPRKAYGSPNETELLLDPQRLARIVCGNAQVYFSRSLECTEEMNYLFRCREYSCYGGSVRIYRPGLDDGNALEAYQHRILSPAFLEEVGEEEVLRIYRRALAQNIGFYESYFGVESCREMKREEQRRQRLEEIRLEHKREMGVLENSIWEEALGEEQKRREAEQKVQELEGHLQEATSKRYALEAQVERMRSAVIKASALEQAAKARMNLDKYPQSPEEMVQYFSHMFSDRLAFSADAIRSLKGCTLSLQELWKVLFYLATVMWELFESEKCPDPYKEFYHRTGMEAKRGAGTMTRKDSRLMEQFKTVYEGRTLNMEPHITYGKEAQSIHFNFDSETKRIVVGHCGEHLEVYSTRKRK